MRYARTVTPGASVRWRMDDEDAAKRRVRVSAQPAPPYWGRLTKRVNVVDPTLLAIARGEIEPEPIARGEIEPEPEPPTVRSPPAHLVNAVDLDAGDDPYGGLIPIFDEDDEDQDDAALADIDRSWLDDDVEPEPFPVERTS